MTWLTKLRDRYLNTSVEATAHYTKVWGECTHCATHTPWIARPARGYYKCLECGRHPLDAEAAAVHTARHEERPPKHDQHGPSVSPSAHQPA